MEETLDEFVTELSLRGVTDVVRVCEPTYNTEKLTVAGIKVHDWAFADGGIPPDKVLADMIQLCESRFTNLLLTSKVIAEKTTDDSSGPVIVLMSKLGGSLCCWAGKSTSACCCSIDRGWATTVGCCRIHKKVSTRCS
jgi:hypothetical protein